MVYASPRIELAAAYPIQTTSLPDIYPCSAEYWYDDEESPAFWKDSDFVGKKVNAGVSGYLITLDGGLPKRCIHTYKTMEHLHLWKKSDGSQEGYFPSCLYQDFWLIYAVGKERICRSQFFQFIDSWDVESVLEEVLSRFKDEDKPPGDFASQVGYYRPDYLEALTADIRTRRRAGQSEEHVPSDLRCRLVTCVTALHNPPNNDYVEKPKESDEQQEDQED